VQCLPAADLGDGGHPVAGTKLPLTTWFLAIYLISQAKTGLSALALKRQLGVSYPTAWLIHHKIMCAMAEREDAHQLTNVVQMDDAYLGGELSGGTPGRGSENKVPFVAAVSLNEKGHPVYLKLTLVAGFTRDAIKEWANAHLAPGTVVTSDGLSCFAAVTDAGCVHLPTVVGDRKPSDLPEFAWVNTVLGNLKTTLAGAHHAFDYRPQVRRPLPGRLRLPVQPPLRFAYARHPPRCRCLAWHPAAEHVIRQAYGRC